MNVQIMFKNAKRSPATDERIYSKINKLSKYFMKWPHVKWNCYMEGNHFYVDVYMHDQHHDFHASACDENMFKSFDDVTAKLERQLKRHHAKIKSKMHLPYRQVDYSPAHYKKYAA